MFGHFIFCVTLPIFFEAVKYSAAVEIPLAYMIYYRFYDYSTDARVVPSGDPDVTTGWFKGLFEDFVVKRYRTSITETIIDPLMMRKYFAEFLNSGGTYTNLNENAVNLAEVIFRTIDHGHDGVINFEELNSFRAEFCLDPLDPNSVHEDYTPSTCPGTSKHECYDEDKYITISNEYADFKFGLY